MDQANDDGPDKDSPNKLKRLVEFWSLAPMGLFLPFIGALALTIMFVFLSEGNYQAVTQGVNSVSTDRDNLDLIDELHSALLNAETAQRGYLLTGNRAVLAPLTGASADLARLEKRLAIAFVANPDRQALVDSLLAVTRKNFSELEMTVALEEAGKRSEAVEIVAQEKGKLLMDSARRKVQQISAEIEVDLQAGRAARSRAIMVARISMLATALLNFVLLLASVYFFMRDLRRRQEFIKLRESENERLSGLIAERTSELNDLSTHLQRSSERERSALARDLHDEMGGVLTSLKMDLDWLRTHLAHSPDVVKRFEQLSLLVDEAVTVKRRVVENLRPSLLDNLGLVPAIEWYINENCARGGLSCKLGFAEELGIISPDAAIALFRIVQEGTTNVLRHAQAAMFSASLYLDGANIQLVLHDDGVGLPETFSPLNLTHGIAGIRHRARSLGGEATWVSAPGKGTTITVTIPRNADS